MRDSKATRCCCTDPACRDVRLQGHGRAVRTLIMSSALMGRPLTVKPVGPAPNAKPGPQALLGPHRCWGCGRCCRKPGRNTAMVRFFEAAGELRMARRGALAVLRAVPTRA